MSRMEAEEEKKKLVDKFFNYAESPIGEWLAEYLGVSENEAFPDYNDDSDDIGFQYKNEQYRAYLLSMPHDTPAQVSKKLLNDSEDARKACSMLFDAVQMVMPGVVHTADNEYAEQLKGMHCKFDEASMSFALITVNTAEYKKGMAVQQYLQVMQVKEQLEKKLAEPDLDEKTRSDFDTRMKQIADLIGKAKLAYEQVTDEDIEQEQTRCKQVDSQLEMASRLHIVVEKLDPSDPDAISESLKRLPVFGITYQDTEDETFTDKLKKEYNLTE